MKARWRTLAALAGATAVAQVAVVLVSPLLTRLYTPADVGVYAATVSVVSIVVVVACLRFEQAIPLPRDERLMASLVVLCVGSAIATTVILGVILVLLDGQIAGMLGIPSVAGLRLPVLLAVLGGTLYSIVSGWAIRCGEFAELARTRVTQAASLLVLQLGFGFLGFGAPGLVLGDAVGRSAGTVRLARIMWHAQRDAFRSVTLASLRAAAGRYRRFAFLSTPSALLDTIAIQAPVFILLALFGPTTAGYYGLASRIGSVPNALAAASVGPMFLEESARQQRDDPALLGTTFLVALRRLALLGLGPTLLIVVAAPILFGLVFGSAWAEAGLYAAILAPMQYMQMITSPLSGILTVLERQDLHLARECVSIGVLGAVVVLAVVAHLDSLQVVAALSAAGTLNAAIYLGVMWLAISRARAAPTPRAVASR